MPAILSSAARRGEETGREPVVCLTYEEDNDGESRVQTLFNLFSCLCDVRYSGVGANSNGHATYKHTLGRYTGAEDAA